MNSRFAVRQLVLTFIPTRGQKAKYPYMISALRNILPNVLGDYQGVNGNTAYIYMPYNCNVFELREAIMFELKKCEALKGLKFKIDLGVKSSEV